MSMGTKSYSRKQAGVVYAAVKRGELEMGKEAIGAMYDHTDYFDVISSLDGRIAVDGISAIKGAVDAIFAKDMALAQVNVKAFEEILAA